MKTLLPTYLNEWLDQHLPDRCSQLLVGFSGGLDSTVLLHALSQVDLPLPVQAVHIHHGLQAEADVWARHCEQAAAAWNVECRVIKVDASKGARQSPEAVARDLRYAALQGALTDHGALLTAHHQGDQAETLLLQLLRGAGLNGLAGMPLSRPLGSGAHLRPLLEFSREQLQAYAQECQLSWVEDPSNQLADYRRNFLRNEVIPLIQEKWPSALESIARSSALLGESLHWQRQTLAVVLQEHLEGQHLRVDSLNTIPAIEQRLLLRTWLDELGATMPSRQQLGQIQQLLQARAKGHVAWGDSPRNHVRLAQGRLIWDAAKENESAAEKAAFDSGAIWEWRLDQPLTIPGVPVVLTRELLDKQGIRLPEGTQHCEVRFRSGSADDRLSLSGHSQSKSLKNFFQERKVPHWKRGYCPLLYVDGVMVAVVVI